MAFQCIAYNRGWLWMFIGHEDHNSTYNMLKIGHGSPARGRSNMGEYNNPAPIRLVCHDPPLAIYSSHSRKR